MHMSRFLDSSVIIVVGLYAATIPLVGNRDISAALRAPLYGLRSYGVVAFLFCALTAYSLIAPGRFRQLRSSGWTLFALSMCFPIYYAIVSMFRGNASVPVIGLYVAWNICTFLVAPLCFGSHRRIRAVVVALLLANLAAWFVGLILDPTFSNSLFSGRLSMGFANPNAYSNVLQIVFVCSWFLLVDNTSARPTSVARMALLLTMTAAVILVVMAVSRNVLVFLIVSVSLYHGMRRGSRALGAYALLVAIGLTALACLIGYIEMTSVNEFSSNRVSFWSTVIEQAFGTKDPLQSVLFGPSEEISDQVDRGGYDDLRADKELHKHHYDSFYLELLIEGGLIGALLFMMPFAILISKLKPVWRRCLAERPNVSWYVAVAFGLAAQGLFVAPFPSFNNSIGFAVALLAHVPIVMLASKDTVLRGIALDG